jgi:hypothetical protein
MAKREAAPRVYHVYVIELDDAVGPRAQHDRECLYVGQTVHSREERFEQHKRGHKSSRFVRKHGLRLRPDLYPEGDLRTRKDAETAEAEWAKVLESRGYRVFGGH